MYITYARWLNICALIYIHSTLLLWRHIIVQTTLWSWLVSQQELNQIQYDFRCGYLHLMHVQHIKVNYLERLAREWLL